MTQLLRNAKHLEFCVLRCLASPRSSKHEVLGTYFAGRDLLLKNIGDFRHLKTRSKRVSPKRLRAFVYARPLFSTRQGSGEKNLCAVWRSKNCSGTKRVCHIHIVLGSWFEFTNRKQTGTPLPKLRAATIIQPV